MQDSKFIGLDVHKATISIAFAKEPMLWARRLSGFAPGHHGAGATLRGSCLAGMRRLLQRS